MSNAKLVEALEQMLVMHNAMMDKVDHARSFYDADTIRLMNEAPIQARQALSEVTFTYDDHPNQDAVIEWAYMDRPMLAHLMRDGGMEEHIAEESSRDDIEYKLNGEPVE